MNVETLDRGDQPFVPAVAPRDLTPDRDVYGNALDVGCRVRSFSSPFLYGDGRVAGLETSGARVRYLEGVLTAIGEVRHEGCARYSITVDRRYSTRSGTTEGEDVPEGDPWKQVIPPLNGTPSTGGDHCFGVVRIDD